MQGIKTFFVFFKIQSLASPVSLLIFVSLTSDCIRE